MTADVKSRLKSPPPNQDLAHLIHGWGTLDGKPDHESLCEIATFISRLDVELVRAGL